MGGNTSRIKTKRRIHLPKGKVPKKLRKFFKTKKKYVSFEISNETLHIDEVDSAVPLKVREVKETKTDSDIPTQRGIEEAFNGRLEVLSEGASGYNNIPSDASEWEKESMSSFDILDIEQRTDSDSCTVSSPDSAVCVNFTTQLSVEDCPLCNAKNIEYMVQVFKPKLQRHLNVKELMPYLFFVNDHIARAIENTEPQECAVDRLIKTVLDSNERGKWTTFLMALDKTGHLYMHQLLTGKTEKDDYFSKEILKIVKPNLINNICLSDIIDYLIEREIINEEDQGHIESAEKLKGPIHATRIMLEKVDKRSPNWDTDFADILHKTGLSEVAAVFKMVEHHEHPVLKDAESPKTKHQTTKMSKRQFKKAKRGKCRLHNQLKGRTENSSDDEPGSKRKKTNISTFSEQGMTNWAFRASGSIPTTNAEEIEAKGSSAELKEIYSFVKAMMIQQTSLMERMDGMMDIFREHLKRTQDEQALFRQQISEHGDALKSLNERVTTKLGIDSH